MTTEAITHLKAVDKVMAGIIRSVGPCTLKPRRQISPFEALVQSVMFQQLNGNAAQTILGRFKKLHNGRMPAPEELLKTSEEQLRAAGLSRAKVLAIRDIASKAVAGLVPDRAKARQLSDPQLVEILTEIRGVGPWTVEMMLIFTLGRTDVLPSTDYGVRQGFARAYKWKELPTPKELMAEGEKWKPFRTTAAWYLWRVLELPAKKN